MRPGSIRRRSQPRKKHEELEAAEAHHPPEASCEPLGLFYCPWQSATAVEDDVDHDCKERRRREEQQAWTQIFSKLIAQWGHWFSHIVAGSGAWVGNVFHRVVARRHEKISDIYLTPLQAERLHKLQERLEVPFDGTRAEHQEALMALWRAAFPECELRSLVTEKWKDMGWQGPDPSTDFRGGGYISLENLLFLAEKHPKSFHRLLHKEGGERAAWEYPFAVAGINVSFMLIQMLDLRSSKPTSTAGLNFLSLLADDEMAFDILYCIAFEVMDTLWLATQASYMEFNAVLASTRRRLEEELSLKHVTHVKDLPSYSLLCR